MSPCLKNSNAVLVNLVTIWAPVLVYACQAVAIWRLVAVLINCDQDGSGDNHKDPRGLADYVQILEENVMKLRFIKIMGTVHSSYRTKESVTKCSLIS